MAMTPVNVTLRTTHATPANPVLWPMASVTMPSTAVYLYSGHATPANITLRDPTVAPSGGGDISIGASTAAIVFAGAASAVVEWPRAPGGAVTLVATTSPSIETPITPSVAFALVAGAAAVMEAPAAPSAAIAMAASAASGLDLSSTASLAFVVAASTSVVVEPVVTPSAALVLAASAGASVDLLAACSADTAIGAWAYPRLSGDRLGQRPATHRGAYGRPRGSRR